MIKHLVSAGAVSLLSAGAASAAIVTLDFEDINPSHPFPNSTFVEDFYDGGAASNGQIGPDYGIQFSDNALVICLNTLDESCSNTSRGGLAPGTELAGLFFLEGDAAIMNVADGFTDGFSFNYVSVSQPGSVSVFDGLDGTGNVLATIDLLPNAGSCPGYGAAFCPFSPIGVAFDGVAMSVAFAGVANQIAFDDITFGSEFVGGEVPAPGALGLLGLAALGLAAARRKR